MSAVQGTPSSQFWGLFVGMQRPPRHWKPLVQMLGPVQSSLWTHVWASAGIIEESVGPPESPGVTPPVSCLVLESAEVASGTFPPSAFATPVVLREPGCRAAPSGASAHHGSDRGTQR